MSPATLTQPVRPEWIDYNGHLSEAYYVLVFGYATDALMDAVGVDADYRAGTGCSLYTVEAHLEYLREVGEGAVLSVATEVLECGARKVALRHRMSVDGEPVAVERLTAVHVDSRAGRAVPFPEDIAERLAGRAQQ